MGELLITMVILVVLLGGTYLIGHTVERRHLRRLEAAERELGDILLSDMKTLPPNWQAANPCLVVGQVVIATDYFKTFAAGLRNLIGGRVRSYETLVERARREAIVRMLREARRAGANVVWNMRLATSTIQGKQANKPGGVEVMAYGTAMQVQGG